MLMSPSKGYPCGFSDNAGILSFPEEPQGGIYDYNPEMVVWNHIQEETRRPFRRQH